ncbi:Dof-type domain-containing protein [Psidium guajava]|nr:Dof-type domain-containing protein [Psidium guajava]
MAQEPEIAYSLLNQAPGSRGQDRACFLETLGGIKFEDEILNIPCFVIDEGTRSLFLNLIALEQSHWNCSNYVTSYVIFMRDLINSLEEVNYLRDHKIIKHCLRSDAEVVDLFNRLCQVVRFDIKDSYLDDLSIKVFLYCSRIWFTFKMARVALAHTWSFWGANLKKKHFDSPWSTISVIAGFILLVLTFTQTFYGVYGYYRPRF